MPENFDFSEHLRATNALLQEAARELLRERQDFDEAWEKRAKEVEELERLFNL